MFSTAKFNAVTPVNTRAKYSPGAGDERGTDVSRREPRAALRLHTSSSRSHGRPGDGAREQGGDAPWAHVLEIVSIAGGGGHLPFVTHSA